MNKWPVFWMMLIKATDDERIEAAVKAFGGKSCNDVRIIKAVQTVVMRLVLK